MMQLRLVAHAWLQQQGGAAAAAAAAAASAAALHSVAPLAALQQHGQRPAVQGDAVRSFSRLSASSSSSSSGSSSGGSSGHGSSAAGTCPLGGAPTAWPTPGPLPAAARGAHQLQQRAGIFVVVGVKSNNVDAAYGKLNRACADNGLYQELRKRDHRETNHALAFKVKRATFNKRIGQQIRERLKWVVKRRHV